MNCEATSKTEIYSNASRGGDEAGVDRGSAVRLAGSVVWSLHDIVGSWVEAENDFISHCSEGCVRYVDQTVFSDSDLIGDSAGSCGN